MSDRIIRYLERLLKVFASLSNVLKGDLEGGGEMVVVEIEQPRRGMRLISLGQQTAH